MRHVASTEISGRKFQFVDLPGVLGGRFSRLPVVMRLLAENHIRTTNGESNEALLSALDEWLKGEQPFFEFSFRPNRLLMHDTTCTPALADVAGLKDAVAEAGGDPADLNPTLPIEVSVDHSLSVDHYAVGDALARNSIDEYERNSERYAFLKWASLSLRNFGVNPPGTGIMHTINLEQLSTILELGSPDEGVESAHPDMLLGTDSHTPMVNGIGVFGWGVGGLEAESVMFGQSVSLGMPEVVGVRLLGELAPGVLSMDVALVVTHRLRELGVTGSFVEFFGVGVSNLTADDRAVIANMAPEYGATTGYFPVDKEAVRYLERTGRPKSLTSTIEPIFKDIGLWFEPTAHPVYSREIEIDLSQIAPSLAGPRRPQDLIAPEASRRAVETVIGRELAAPDGADDMPDGAVGIAAITSCTTTSDPRLLIASGLLARNARRHGLTAKPWVKTSLAPGSPSAQDFLRRANLLDDLGHVGFDIVGFGCTTCIGNSGPLPEIVDTALQVGKAVVAVVSSNRNFPGRVHPRLDLGYLASPPMVIAYALLGHIKTDILVEPLGTSPNGTPVYLRDIWPTAEEINAAMKFGFRSDDVHKAFAKAAASESWKDLDAPISERFPWDPKSRYLRRPKFASLDEKCRLGNFEAAPLLVLGDDITTDHISPAGAIDVESEAGRWLVENGGNPNDLNVFAAYRGNWEVMLRGLYTNKLARNYLMDGLSPGHTCVDGEANPMPLYIAAERYRERGISNVILAGERYGMGSSRDWAAKGVGLLASRAVIARSFERIHRTNLVGMGVLPIKILDNFVPETADMSAADRVSINCPAESLSIRKELDVKIVSQNGTRSVHARADVETEQEVETLKAGGVLPLILKSRIPATKRA